MMKVFLVLATLMILSGCNKPDEPVPTPSDIAEHSTGLLKDPRRAYGVMHFKPKSFKGDIPANFSWEDKGYATPVRDQKSCGSCWAFGGTQTIEMGYKIFGGKDIDFSEQDLVGKLFYGCQGGYFTGEFQVSKGQTDEASCKYTASNSKCPASAKPAGKGTSWGLIGQVNRSPSVDELQTAIQTYGAIAVTVTANSTFMNYKGGLSTSCPHGQTNHIVTLTGWKTGPDGKVYFKVKNSWGTSWGENGYGYFQAGCFDLAEEASYLAVEAVPCKPPAVKLPAEFVLNYGDDIVLAAKNIPGVTYSWWVGKDKIGDGPSLELTASESMFVVLRTKNQCGEGEIQSIVTVKK